MAVTFKEIGGQFIDIGGNAANATRNVFAQTFGIGRGAGGLVRGLGGAAVGLGKNLVSAGLDMGNGMLNLAGSNHFLGRNVARAVGAVGIYVAGRGIFRWFKGHKEDNAHKAQVADKTNELHTARRANINALGAVNPENTDFRGNVRGGTSRGFTQPSYRG